MTRRSQEGLAQRIAVALALVGCQGNNEVPRRILPAPMGSVVVDSAPEGAQADGDVDAFGLMLPRGSDVTARFPDAIYARVSLTLEEGGNYFRDRVDARRVETGPAKTVFERAKPKRDASRLVRVEVTQIARNRLELVVRDETPKPDPAPSGLSEAERWRRAGMTPDGKKPLVSE